MSYFVLYLVSYLVLPVAVLVLYTGSERAEWWAGLLQPQEEGGRGEAGVKLLLLHSGEAVSVLSGGRSKS